MEQLVRSLVLLLPFACAATAQTDARPEFEVASVKPAAPGSRGMFVRVLPGGRVNITNMTLKELIVIAYGIQPFQISGGPAWLDSVRYDIVAKPESGPKQADIPLMLQALLADRFQLTFKRQTKDLPIYALVLARKDGKLGPGLTASKEGGCTPPDPSKPLPLPPPEPGKPPALACGNFMMQPRMLRAVDLPLEQIAPALSRYLGRTVIDKTGLTPKFDIILEWTPDEAQLAMLPGDAPKPPASDPAGPSIFTAIQEQLGLKLDAQKGPVDIFVIERAEKPSEN